MPPSLGRSLLGLLVPTVCPACDRPRREGEPLLCERCASSLVRLPALGRTFSALAYEGAAAVLIRRLKFEGRRDGIPLLARALVDRLGGLEFEGIVPVPRHWSRIREQGCDPVYDLARAVGRSIGRPVLARALGRRRPVPPQIGLPPAERRRSPVGSFRARAGAVRGQSVLLLDDVVTTGATLAAAARELRRAGGARRVLRVAATARPRGLSIPGATAL